MIYKIILKNKENSEEFLIQTECPISLINRFSKNNADKNALDVVYSLMNHIRINGFDCEIIYPQKVELFYNVSDIVMPTKELDSIFGIGSIFYFTHDITLYKYREKKINDKNVYLLFQSNVFMKEVLINEEDLLSNKESIYQLLKKELQNK